MDGIERAIRTALEKGDAGDAGFRERVYRQAFAALDKALKSNPGLTVEGAIKRRQALQAKVAEIEHGFLAPVAPRATGAGAPELGGATRSADGPSPSVELDTGPELGHRGDLAVAAPRLDPVLERSADPGEAPALGIEERPVPTRRRRGFAWLFVAATLLAAVGIGAWWAVDTGLFRSAAERDTSVPNPPTTLEEESFDPQQGSTPPPLSEQAGAAEDRDWISIFEPADAAGVTAAGGAVAEIAQEDGEAYLHVVSPGAENAVLFDVGQGALETLAGRKAVFVISARAEEGRGTQISVECNFGELGDCGRRRYEVGYERADYLFEIELPNRPPGSEGTIAITSDFEGQGRAVDIYEIRAARAE